MIAELLIVLVGALPELSLTSPPGVSYLRSTVANTSSGNGYHQLASSNVSVARCRLLEHIARSTNCPSDKWMAKAATLLMRPAMTFVNIGANKGYTVNGFLQVFQQGWVVSNKAWHLSWLAALTASDPNSTRCSPAKKVRHAMHFAADKDYCCKRDQAFSSVAPPWVPCMCGICADCLSARPRGIAAGAAQVTVLAVEMMQSTAQLLRQLFERHGVRGYVVNAAASDTIGIHKSRAVKPGEEAYGLGPTRQQRSENLRPGYQKVEKLTVDVLVQRHDETSNGTIDVLVVDVEGFDEEVLHGARRTLNRTRVVEFESNGRRALAIVNWLNHNYNFSCFWNGGGAVHEAHLAPVEGQCSFGVRSKFWSNVVCSRDPTVLPIMESLDHVSKRFPLSRA